MMTTVEISLNQIHTKLVTIFLITAWFSRILFMLRIKNSIGSVLGPNTVSLLLNSTRNTNSIYTYAKSKRALIALN